jgi:tRNA nucleotidyltransferase (CCA-adding enzyme)
MPSGEEVLDRGRDIARAVRERGGRALVVGGWVRDQLLGRPSKDLDLEVFGVPPDELQRVLAGFGRVEAAGQSFPVYKVGDIDVSLPRPSRSGPATRFRPGDPPLRREAARRRDFTINAILFDPLTGDYLDPHGGRADLERRVLRAVDPATFGDDSLRVLRGLLFAARFDLTMDEDTKAPGVPPTTPAERVWARSRPVGRAAVTTSQRSAGRGSCSPR